MILFPAIDLKNGEAVRLQQGDMARATVFNRDPAAQALAFARQGFEYLHIVDLDGAFAGKPMNAQAVERILAAVKIPAQLGGGIRDRARSRAGSARALRASSSAPRRCAIRRWSRTRRAHFRAASRSGSTRATARSRSRAGRRRRSLPRSTLARRFEDAGVAAIVYTDVARDGMLKGLNLEATIALAERVSMPVIASGGLASLDDVRALLEPRAQKLQGAIAGRALYDGRLDAAAALALLRGARATA